MKHTPGPFEAFIISDYKPNTILETYLKKISILGPVKDNGGQTHLAEVSVHSLITEDESKANAYLFAAAPELLAAVERIKSKYIDDHSRSAWHEDYSDIQAVIDKARGER